MVRLVIVKNPFAPAEGRIVKLIECEGTSIEELLKQYAIEGVELQATINGYMVEGRTKVRSGDFVVLFPVIAKGGGKVLGVIAAVALSVVSFGVGGLVSGVGWSALGATAGWTTIGYLSAAAVMFIGSSLIGRTFYGTSDLGAYGSYENNPTYSWSDVQTMEGQNNAIAITYGTVKSAGQTISKFVSIASDKEYLNWLIAAGEGPLTISNVLVNDNPVEYYEGMTLETREGVNNQPIISNFDDTYFTKSLGYQLLETERIDSAQGNATEGIIAKVEFSSGLYYAEDNGSLGNAWVELQGLYRKKGETDWTQFIGERVNGSQSSALRREWRVDNLPSGEYEVKMKVIARSHEVTNSRASVRCYWSSVTSIVYDDFSYPNIALVGIKALATDQISGSPTVSFLKTREYVLVWNPYTEIYEQKASDNPAWACYDMIHMASQLYNVNTLLFEYEVRGVKKELMLYDQFKEWADFCDSKNFKINIEINQAGDMLEVINQKIANVGRGMVVRFGTRYGCVWDCVKQPVQMFGMGNIISGSFQEEFLQTSDRANLVEVTYTDAASDYSRQTVCIYSDTYDKEEEEKAAQITYDGITSYEQAYREGVYQLYCNKYQLRTISFQANVDAIACTLGDVILVAHDVPKWAKSGRIYAISGRSLLLPVELDSTEGSYRIMYRTVNDNLYSSAVEIERNENGWCQVYVLTPFAEDDPPQVDDIFDLALANVGSKPFVVKSITRELDFTRKIECIEYNENLYNEDYEIPPIQYATPSQTAQNVTGLNASQITYVTEDGRRVSRLYASWNIPSNGGRFTVLISSDGGNTYNVLQSQISASQIETDMTANTEYWLKVVTVLGITKSSGVIYGPIPIGEDKKPPDVISLDTEVLANGTRRYNWSFEYPEPNDIAGFKFKYIQGTTPNWENGYLVQEGLVVTQPYETSTVRQGEHTIMIKAVDNAGQESKNYAACVVDFGEPLEENVLYTKDFSENNWGEIETDGSIAEDGTIHSNQTSAYWKSKTNHFWQGKNVNHWDGTFSSFYLATSFTAPASGNFWLKYDIRGYSNLMYKIRGKDNLYKQYSTKVKVSGGDVIDIRFETPESGSATVLYKLLAIIDVPDQQEHFENLVIPEDGLTLPIKTPNYYTTSVRIDSVQVVDGKGIFPQIVSKTPCVIKIIDSTGAAVATTADITWQGFIKETAEERRAQKNELT